MAFMGTKVNGDDFPARLGVYFPRTPEGGLDLAHGVVSITDISQLMTALESNQNLLVGVSHQLRTPLTGILGFTRELLESPQLLDRVERTQLLAIIADEADSMANTIDDLVIAARSDMAQLTVTMTPIAMAPYLAALGAKLPVGVGKSLRFGDCDLTICADPTRIGQILRNLVNNAVAHGGDEITIEASIADGLPVITVSDNGPGIPEAQAEKIFEPYASFGNKLGQPKPLGLGLTISRRLARAMGGDLVHRRQDGRTEFLLLLPSPEAIPPRSHQPALTACPGCDRSGACTWSLSQADTSTIAQSKLIETAA
jgi:signal transduction histidine kinase